MSGTSAPGRPASPGRQGGGPLPARRRGGRHGPHPHRSRPLCGNQGTADGGYWSSYLIEACLAAGRLAEGLDVTREALALSETQLDVPLDAELLRLEGELLHASGEAEAAEVVLRKSLDLARVQGARAFELRTATCLGRLLVEQGRAAEVLPALTAA